jgi:pilus assembly protein FimV
MLKVPTLAQMRAISPAVAAERIDQIKRGHAVARTAAKPARRAKPAVAEQPAPASASEAASAHEPEATSPPPAAVSAEKAAPPAPAPSAAPAAPSSATTQAAAESAYAEPAKPGAAAAAPAPAEPAAEAAAPAPADTLPGSVPTQNSEPASPAPAAEQPQPIPPAQPAPAAAAKPKVVSVPSASMQGLLYPLIAALGVLLLGLLGLQAWKKRQSAKSRRKIEPIQGLKFGIPQQPDAGAPPAPAVKIPELSTAAAAVSATQKLPAAEDTAQLPQFDSTQMIDAPLDAKTSKGISTDTVDFDVTGKFEAETMKVDLDGDDPITEADFHLAYGLYDEAALLLTNAAKKEPKRTDLRTKLAETYFRAGKALEFQETAETLKPEVSPAEWQKIAIMGHQLMPDSELFAGGGSLDTESLGHDVDLAFDEPAKATAPAAPAPAPTRPEPAQSSAHTLDFSLEDFDAVTTGSPTASPAKPETPATASPSDNTLEFNLEDFDLEKPAAKETVAPVVAQTLPADEVKIDDDFSLDNMPDDSHAISTGDEAATKLDLARAYVDMGDNETAVTLLNEVMQQGSDEQKKDAEALIKRMA